MITRAKLVEQLREYQIRSQHKADVTVALLLSALFGVLVVSSLVTLYFRHFWLCLLILCISIFIPLRLRNSRKSLARKRERRMLLPLSM